MAKVAVAKAMATEGGGDRTRTCEGLLPYAFQAYAVATGPLLQEYMDYSIFRACSGAIICACQSKQRRSLLSQSLLLYGEAQAQHQKLYL